MAYAAQMKRSILNFEDGCPYDIALKYPNGKEVSNGRVMFSTTTEEVFFLDPFDAESIYGLNLRPQEKFRLVKHGRNIEVSRIVKEQPAPSAPAAPVTTAAAMPERAIEQTPQQTQGSNSWSRLMASSYISAIDALLVARDYAESKGIAFKLSPQELRSSAHCIFIASQRGAR